MEKAPLSRVGRGGVKEEGGWWRRAWKETIESCFFNELVVSDKAMGSLRGYVINRYVSFVRHSLLFEFKLLANILKLVANI